MDLAVSQEGPAGTPVALLWPCPGGPPRVPLPLCPPGMQAAGRCSLPHGLILVPGTCCPQVVVLNGCASLFSALATVLCEAGGE